MNSKPRSQEWSEQVRTLSKVSVVHGLARVQPANERALMFVLHASRPREPHLPMAHHALDTSSYCIVGDDYRTVQAKKQHNTVRRKVRTLREDNLQRVLLWTFFIGQKNQSTRDRGNSDTIGRLSQFLDLFDIHIYLLY